MADRFKNPRLRRLVRGRRTLRASRPTFAAGIVRASEAGGAAAAAPVVLAPPVTTSLATLLTRHVLRDGEIILLIIKPSLWYLFFTTLPALGVAIIAALSTKLWAPHHLHLGIEFGLMLITCRLAWAILSWAGRVYLLTDLRVVRISGVFSPQVQDVPLRKVARSRLISSLHERIWRLGSIEIIPESDHWPWSVWQTIARPGEVNDTIRRAVARAKQGGCHLSG